MSRANTLRPGGTIPRESIQETISTLLTERECSILDKGITGYRKRGDITTLVQSLSIVLNTNQKRQLLVPIRDAFVKPPDRIKFNNFAVKYGIAVSRDGTKKREKTLERERNPSGARKIDVKRDKVGEWGFSIRGGSEHGTGIFVSWVDPGSLAQKSGLQAGDQVLKLNETSFEGISHYEATQTLRGCRKARLWLKLQGKFPGVQYATRSYRWIGADGRPASPPPERLQSGVTDSGSLRGNNKIRLDPDERKVSIMVSEGKELGVSIRGGAEHGLGIYISKVDNGSVADDYGLKPGDQILEVNGISFISILHSEAAKALRAQRLMVIKVKDVGKIPHSRVTTIGQTEWHSSPTHANTLPSKTSSRAVSQDHLNKNTISSAPVFATGAGTQVMLTKSSSPARGIMNEVARSLLTVQELSSFKYYINEYEQRRVSVEDLAQALLELLNTKEKIQLITEVRNIIRGEDLEQFNEMTIHKEIEARSTHRPGLMQAGSQQSISSEDGGGRRMGSYNVHAQESNLSLLTENVPEFSQQNDDGPMLLAVTRTKEDDEDSLDHIPQRMPPSSFPKFTVPPPPSSIPPMSSTPHNGLIADTMRDRRRQVYPNSSDSQMLENAWDDTDNATTSMVDEETLQRRLKETEERLKAEYEQKQQELLEEKAREIEEEQRQKFEAEKAELEERIEQIGNQSKEQLEEEIWQQAEVHMREELREEIAKETEERLREEFEMQLQQKMAENLRRRDSDSRRKNISRMEEEEQLRIELEEQVKAETEEQVRIEYEERLQRESEEKARLAEEVKSYRNLRESLEEEKKQRKQLEEARKEAEERAKREAEEKEQLEELLMEARKQAEEEKRQAEENEDLEKQREERRREEEKEKKKLQEERRKLEEQRKKMEKEMKLREEEARRREEEAQRIEEEAQRIEEEARRREEEALRREEEAQRREEEARQREDENSRRREEEEARQREAEEEAQRRDEEEEEMRRMEEEEMRRIREEEEEMRRREEEEEMRRREEEELRRIEEEEEELRRLEEEERMREEEEMQLRQEQEQREKKQRQEAELKRREREKKKKAPAVSSFDPLAMDDLIMQSGSISGGGISTNAAAAVVPRRTKAAAGNGNTQASRKQQIEQERRRAEQMLMKQMMRAKQGPTAPKEDGLSFGGYTGLKGKIVTVSVTKVSRKLGIAVEGGATTKNQRGVVIRQITPDGSAALTGEGLSVGQQILTVGGKSLKGLKHKDAVITIKNAFDGPMNKKIEFVVLERDEEEEADD